MLPFVMTTKIRATSTKSLYITAPVLWGIRPGMKFLVTVTNRETEQRICFYAKVCSRGSSSVFYVPKRLAANIFDISAPVNVSAEPIDDIPPGAEDERWRSRPRAR